MLLLHLTPRASSAVGLRYLRLQGVADVLTWHDRKLHRRREVLGGRETARHGDERKLGGN